MLKASMAEKVEEEEGTGKSDKCLPCLLVSPRSWAMEP